MDSGFTRMWDVDVLNDAVMPAVDSRKNDGLSYAELTTVLNGWLVSEKAAGLNITILGPELDPEGTVTSGFIDALALVIDQYLIDLLRVDLQLITKTTIFLCVFCVPLFALFARKLIFTTPITPIAQSIWQSAQKLSR